MKKIGGILTIFLLTLAIISSASATELFGKDLKYGVANNAEVKRLQEYLKDEKLYTGPLSGNYYGLTQLAIKKLQKKYGLKQDGKFNYITRERLNKTLSLKLELDQKSKELEEAQQLAESIEALKQYETMKAQQSPITQNDQNKALTPEEFAVKYPNATPLPTLPATPTQPSNPIEPTPQPSSITLRKAVVSLEAKTELSATYYDEDYAKGNNSDMNRKNANLPLITNKQIKTLNIYVDPDKGVKTNLRILVNLNNPPTENYSKDFSCIKSGNNFWKGNIQNTDSGLDDVLLDQNDLYNNYRGKTLRFAVQCTNLDGTTSGDYLDVFITSELPK